MAAAATSAEPPTQEGSSSPASDQGAGRLLLPHRNNPETPMHDGSREIVKVSHIGQEAEMQDGNKEIVKVSARHQAKKKVFNPETPPRIMPSVGAFTVQCALCLKWRLIPTKEQYEQIRESVLEKPFVCKNARSWRPGASCNEPSDVCQDETHLWAIDKPNIPVAPPGWERQLVFRAAGSSKFADVYYVSPSGKKLRSLPEVERYLTESPEAGVRPSQFSFLIPRPLDTSYCRKKKGASSSEIQKKLPSTSNSKTPQSSSKLAIKRKAFEALAPEEFTIRKGSLRQGAMVMAGKFEVDGSVHDSAVSEEAVEGLLPPESMKGALLGTLDVNEPMKEDPLAMSEAPPTAQQTTEETALQDLNSELKDQEASS